MHKSQLILNRETSIILYGQKGKGQQEGKEGDGIVEGKDVEMGEAKKKEIRLKKLEYNGNKIELKKPIVAKIQKYGEGYILTYDELEIYSIGETIEECKEFFQEEVFVLIELYLVPDEGLTVGGIKLKKKLEAILRQ